MGAAALVVVAHQGGWDEVVLVAIPMVVLVALLWLAKRRAAAESDVDEGPQPLSHPDDPPPEGR